MDQIYTRNQNVRFALQTQVKIIKFLKSDLKNCFQNLTK